MQVLVVREAASVTVFVFCVLCWLVACYTADRLEETGLQEPEP